MICFRILNLLVLAAIWHSLLIDNWFIFACQHQAPWPVATLLKVQPAPG